MTGAEFERFAEASLTHDTEMWGTPVVTWCETCKDWPVGRFCPSCEQPAER